MPQSYTLDQNYPNPFNPTTKIGFKIRNAGFTSLKVYDVVGREIATLMNEKKEAGEYAVQFDAHNLPSAVYLYRLRVGNVTESRKMILLK